MTNQAEAYAQSVARGIWDDYEAGAMFGYMDDDADMARSATDYLADSALDIMVTTDWRNPDTVYGAHVMITCGGPNVWIDTADCTLTAYWGSTRSVQPLPREFCAGLYTVITELRAH